MIKFIKRVVPWALSIISVVFIFVPEAVFGENKILLSASNTVNIIVNRVLLFLVVVVLVSIVYLSYLHYRKSVHIKGKNYTITISYGDIFDMPVSKKVIPFDECFSTEMGHEPAQVKPSSVCGQYLTRYPIANIRSLIDKAQLKPCKGKSKYTRTGFPE